MQFASPLLPAATAVALLGALVDERIQNVYSGDFDYLNHRQKEMGRRNGKTSGPGESSAELRKAGCRAGVHLSA